MAVRKRWRYPQPKSRFRTARLADLPITWVAETLSKQGPGRNIHFPTSLARRRVHACAEKQKVGFPMSPPHEKEVKNESAVSE